MSPVYPYLSSSTATTHLSPRRHHLFLWRAPNLSLPVFIHLLLSTSIYYSHGRQRDLFKIPSSHSTPCLKPGSGFHWFRIQTKDLILAQLISAALPPVLLYLPWLHGLAFNCSSELCFFLLRGFLVLSFWNNFTYTLPGNVNFQNGLDTLILYCYGPFENNIYQSLNWHTNYVVYFLHSSFSKLYGNEGLQLSCVTCVSQVPCPMPSP